MSRGRQASPRSSPSRVTGGARPQEFDPIHQLGGDEPHLNYPLRNVGEPSFTIAPSSGGAERVGTVSLQQAIREAYPGAVYLHMARGYRVFEWRNTAFDRTIKVGPTSASGSRSRSSGRS